VPATARSALVTGVIFTFPLHAVRALVHDDAPFRVPGLIGVARLCVHAQNRSYDYEGKHRFEQTHHWGTSHRVDRPGRREAAGAGMDIQLMSRRYIIAWSWCQARAQ
jgi:hypothetical protein